MSFTDAIRKSLGFEESEGSKNSSSGSNFMDRIKDLTKPQENYNQQQPRTQQQYNPKPAQDPVKPYKPTPKPVYDDFEYIVPEQSLYEIILIRPKTIDDINYVVDQVIEENNPVILDLSFLEKESPANFKLAGDKIKQMRASYGAQALLLARSSEKNLIIVSPKKVEVKNKG